MELAEYRRMAQAEDRHWWYRSARALLDDLLTARLPANGTYLDIGAGTGATGAWLADHGTLVAADFEPVALELHRERHPASRTVAADAQRLPFADASFDLVMEVTMLCHRSIVDPAVVVAEMARVARPGGLVLLWEPGVRRLARAHDRETHSARRFARADLVALVERCGLELDRATGAFSFLVPPAALKTLVEGEASASDLDRHVDGLRGALGGLASAERRVLRRVDLPAGLSVIAVARRSAAPERQ